MDKADNLRSVRGDGTTATTALYFTCDSTSRSGVLPATWANKFVKVINPSTTQGAYYYIGQNSTDQCHSAPTAADSGAVTNPERLGGYLAPGQADQFLLPGLRQGLIAGANPGQNYFVRAAAATAPLEVHLAE